MTRPRRAKGDGTLFKRADGYWVGGIELPPKDGKRRFKRVVRKDRNEAIAVLRQLRKDLDAGVIATSPSTTVANWLDEWLKIKKPHLAPGTHKSYSNTARLYINPHLGTKRIDKLKPADIRDMINTVKTTPTKRSPNGSTRNAQKAYTVLRMALDGAIRERILTYNVTDAVDKPDHLPKEGVAFAPDIAEHIILTAFKTRGQTWGTRWAAGFLTGVRENELLGLTWDRVDFDLAEADISWQLQPLQKTHGCGDKIDGKYPCGKVRVSFCPDAYWDFDPAFDHHLCERSLVWTRPKTKAGRRPVPLVPPLLAGLKRLKAADTGPNPHNLVFHHPDGRPISQDQDQKAWRELLQAAGVPHARQHSIRHSTATLLAKHSVPEHVRMAILGQVSIAAHRGYLHADREAIHAGWGKLAAFMPELPGMEGG